MLPANGLLVSTGALVHALHPQSGMYALAWKRTSLNLADGSQLPTELQPCVLCAMYLPVTAGMLQTTTKLKATASRHQSYSDLES